MEMVAERLRRVEDRLERLLASGWRNAGAEAADYVEAMIHEGMARISAGAALLPDLLHWSV